MTRVRTAFLFLTLALCVSCSKSTPAPESGGELTSLLPPTVIGFFAGNFQDENAKAFMSSREYGAYTTQIFSMAQAAGPEAQGMDTYFEVIKALKLVPDGKETFQSPFEKTVSFAARNQAGQVECASYYRMVPGQSAVDMVARVREQLQRKGFTITEVKGEGYAGFSIRPFEGASTVPPGFALYRTALGIETIFFAASPTQLTVATSEPLVARGFGPGRNEAESWLRSEQAQRSLKAAGVTAASWSYGLLDVQRVIDQLQDSSIPRDKIPLQLVAFTAPVQPFGFSATFAAVVEPRDPQQQQVLTALQGAPAAKSLFASLPAGSAFAFSLDGAAARTALDSFGAGMPEEEAATIRELVGKIERLNAGVSAPGAGSPIPNITISLASSDAPGLMKTLVSLTPKLLPMPGLEWAPAGETAYAMATPLGMPLNLRTENGSVVLSLSPPAAKELSALPVVQEFSKGPVPAVVAVLIDYSSFGELFKMAPPTLEGRDQMISQFEKLSTIGPVVFGLSYADGVVRINAVQRFQSAQ